MVDAADSRTSVVGGRGLNHFQHTRLKRVVVVDMRTHWRGSFRAFIAPIQGHIAGIFACVLIPDGHPSASCCFAQVELGNRLVMDHSSHVGVRRTPVRRFHVKVQVEQLVLAF